MMDVAVKLVAATTLKSDADTMLFWRALRSVWKRVLRSKRLMNAVSHKASPA